MTEASQSVMFAGDWLDLFLHFLSLSIMSVGGGLTTVSEMHRYLVVEHGWLSEAQFNASISIAQAAPGPNILFVALMGWNVGLNAGSMLLGVAGMIIMQVGILLPSTTLAAVIARVGHRHRNMLVLRAIKQGAAPVVVSLLFAASWLIGRASGRVSEDWMIWLLALLAAGIASLTRIHLLWLLGIGALLGALGLV
jgi:chromate transporter